MASGKEFTESQSCTLKKSRPRGARSDQGCETLPVALRPRENARLYSRIKAKITGLYEHEEAVRDEAQSRNAQQPGTVRLLGQCL